MIRRALKGKAQIIPYETLENPNRDAFDLIGGVCFKPDWCRLELTDINKVSYCLSASLYNIQEQYMKYITNFNKIGDKENSIFYSTLLNRLYHLSGYLLLAFTQEYYTGEKIEESFSRTDYECIRKSFACLGIDISCIIECLGIYGYEKRCTGCAIFG